MSFGTERTPMVHLIKAPIQTPQPDSYSEGITSSFSWEFDTRTKRLHTPGKLTRTLDTPAGTKTSTVDAKWTGDDLGDWWHAYLTGAELSDPEAAARPVRTVELFCGSGGLALGFKRACSELGFETVSMAAIDQDSDALSVYQANHHARLISDRSVSAIIDFSCRGKGDDAKFLYAPELVTSDFGVDAARWDSLVDHVDVVLAGPPCQGHSNLNNHTRRTDARNDLYLTVPAFAIAVGAPIVIIENVPAVIHDRRGVVAKTKQLLKDAGYSVTDGVISASSMGWPQHRQRYFIVARRDQAPLQLASVSTALRRDVPLPLWWAIKDLENQKLGEGLHLTAEVSPENQQRIDWLFDNEAYDLPLSERPDCHKQGTSYGAVYGRLRQQSPAPTLTTGFLTPGRGRYIHPTRRRTLTPWEAARLQGFPDTYKFELRGRTPYKQQLGKWIGDAVPMPLGFAAAMSALASGPIVPSK